MSTDHDLGFDYLTPCLSQQNVCRNCVDVESVAELISFVSIYPGHRQTELLPAVVDNRSYQFAGSAPAV